MLSTTLVHYVQGGEESIDYLFLHYPMALALCWDYFSSRSSTFFCSFVTRRL